MGIVIKGPEILESTRRVDTIVLYKTGTVTSGRMALVKITVVPGFEAKTYFSLWVLSSTPRNIRSRAVDGHSLTVRPGRSCSPNPAP